MGSMDNDGIFLVLGNAGFLSSIPKQAMLWKFLRPKLRTVNPQNPEANRPVDTLHP